jgi:hypothetical protein
MGRHKFRQSKENARCNFSGIVSAASGQSLLEYHGKNASVPAPWRHLQRTQWSTKIGRT